MAESSAAQSMPLRVRGVGRVWDEPRALLVLLTDVPSDDDLRSLDDFLQGWDREEIRRLRAAISRVREAASQPDSSRFHDDVWKAVCQMLDESTQPRSEADMSEVAAFKKQQLGGAIVATIYETDDALLEIMKRSDGTFDLIVHNRRGETDRWDDCSVTLKPAHFQALGSIAEQST